MATGRRVGVIVPAHVLRRVIRRRPTWEYADKYAQAAKGFDLDVVLFSPKGCDLRRRTVRGYVRRAGRWRAWRGPLPEAIHNRIIAESPAGYRLLRSLTRKLGPGLFNPRVARDKWVVWKRLAGSDLIDRHLPPTRPLQAATCNGLPAWIRRHRGAVIKPRLGGLGEGILFIQPVAAGRDRFRVTSTAGRSYVIGTRALRRLLRCRAAARRTYIVQKGVPLFKYRGRRCDVRVPVQRGGDGEWQVMEATVKRASRHLYLTNIARGGKAYACRPVLDAAFGAERAEQIWADVSRLCLATAVRLSDRYPGLADLGLDIGIDVDGKPWLIEVNFRDQRLPSKRAGQRATHAQLYHNPMAYANYVLGRPRGRADETHRRVGR